MPSCPDGQLDIGCGCGEGPPPCSQPNCPCTNGSMQYTDWITTDDHPWNNGNSWLNFGDFECGQEIPDTYNNAQNGLGNSVIGNCGPCRKTEVQFKKRNRVCQQGACDCVPCNDYYYIHDWRCSEILPECQGSNPPMSDSFGEFNPSEYTYFPPIPGLVSGTDYCPYDVEVLGCTDEDDINFNPSANTEDWVSCSQYQSGCTDPSAQNYNSSASVDNGTCNYGCGPNGFVPIDCCLDSNPQNGLCDNITENPDNYQIEQVSICTNHSEPGFYDGIIDYPLIPGGCADADQFYSGNNYIPLEGSENETYGCMDETACNCSDETNHGCLGLCADCVGAGEEIPQSCLDMGFYNPNASIDDGSCIYPTPMKSELTLTGPDNSLSSWNTTTDYNNKYIRQKYTDAIIDVDEVLSLSESNGQYQVVVIGDLIEFQGEINHFIPGICDTEDCGTQPYPDAAKLPETYIISEPTEDFINSNFDSYSGTTIASSLFIPASWDLYGCTDELANNYNSYATLECQENCLADQTGPNCCCEYDLTLVGMTNSGLDTAYNDDTGPHTLEILLDVAGTGPVINSIDTYFETTAGEPIIGDPITLENNLGIQVPITFPDDIVGIDTEFGETNARINFKVNMNLNGESERGINVWWPGPLPENSYEITISDDPCNIYTCSDSNASNYDSQCDNPPTPNGCPRTGECVDNGSCEYHGCLHFSSTNCTSANCVNLLNNVGDYENGYFLGNPGNPQGTNYVNYQFDSDGDGTPDTDFTDCSQLPYGGLCADTHVDEMCRYSFNTCSPGNTLESGLAPSNSEYNMPPSLSCYDTYVECIDNNTCTYKPNPPQNVQVELLNYENKQISISWDSDVDVNYQWKVKIDATQYVIDDPTATEFIINLENYNQDYNISVAAKRQNDNDEYWTYDDEWWFGNRGAYVSENQIIQSNWSESIDFKIGETGCTDNGEKTQTWWEGGEENSYDYSSEVQSDYPFVKACNYSATAQVEDGSCTYPPSQCFENDEASPPEFLYCGALVDDCDYCYGVDGKPDNPNTADLGCGCDNPVYESRWYDEDEDLLGTPNTEIYVCLGGFDANGPNVSDDPVTYGEEQNNYVSNQSDLISDFKCPEFVCQPNDDTIFWESDGTLKDTWYLYSLDCTAVGDSCANDNGACVAGNSVDECGICGGKGKIETWYNDADGDGFGCTLVTSTTCPSDSPNFVTLEEPSVDCVTDINGSGCVWIHPTYSSNYLGTESTSAQCDCTSNLIDSCGICDGDNSTCTGCLDNTADNYNLQVNNSDCYYYDENLTEYNTCTLDSDPNSCIYTPINLTTSVTQNQITITWNDSTNAGSYEIFRNDDDYTTAIGTSSTNSYTDILDYSSLSDGASLPTYSYKVKSVHSTFTDIKSNLSSYVEAVGQSQELGESVCGDGNIGNYNSQACNYDTRCDEAYYTCSFTTACDYLTCGGCMDPNAENCGSQVCLDNDTNYYLDWPTNENLFTNCNQLELGGVYAGECFSYHISAQCSYYPDITNISINLSNNQFTIPENNTSVTLNTTFDYLVYMHSNTPIVEEWSILSGEEYAYFDGNTTTIGEPEPILYTTELGQNVSVTIQVQVKLRANGATPTGPTEDYFFYKTQNITLSDIDIYGCTDPNALNYNINATREDDFSEVLQPDIDYFSNLTYCVYGTAVIGGSEISSEFPAYELSDRDDTTAQDIYKTHISYPLNVVDIENGVVCPSATCLGYDYNQDGITNQVIARVLSNSLWIGNPDTDEDAVLCVEAFRNVCEGNYKYTCNGIDDTETCQSQGLGVCRGIDDASFVFPLNSSDICFENQDIYSKVNGKEYYATYIASLGWYGGDVDLIWESTGFMPGQGLKYGISTYGIAINGENKKLYMKWDKDVS